MLLTDYLLSVLLFNYSIDYHTKLKKERKTKERVEDEIRKKLKDIRRKKEILEKKRKKPNKKKKKERKNVIGEKKIMFAVIVHMKCVRYHEWAE